MQLTPHTLGEALTCGSESSSGRCRYLKDGRREGLSRDAQCHFEEENKMGKTREVSVMTQAEENKI